MYDTHPKKYIKIYKKKSLNMSAKSHKKHIDEREHKDITCAVRLPQSLYQSLSDAAKITNSSLSDIMREAIVEKLDLIREAQIAKSLRRAEIEAKVSKLGLDTNSKSKAELDALLDLLEAS